MKDRHYRTKNRSLARQRRLNSRTLSTLQKLGTPVSPEDVERIAGTTGYQRRRSPEEVQKENEEWEKGRMERRQVAEFKRAEKRLRYGVAQAPKRHRDYEKEVKTGAKSVPTSVIRIPTAWYELIQKLGTHPGVAGKRLWTPGELVAWMLAKGMGLRPGNPDAVSDSAPLPVQVREAVREFEMWVEEQEREWK